jgi:hypothetical protein
MSLDSRNAKKIYADYGWRSNTDTPSQILFELFTKDGDFCQQMVNFEIRFELSKGRKIPCPGFSTSTPRGTKSLY